jgi:D-glucosaminate-6-phosphate ammonia-lyase
MAIATTVSSIYEELGVTPVINARGNNTVLGGSTPSPRVKAAIERAERYFVDMEQLLARSGEIVAGLLGAEAAYVTPGAAAAMALGTAACITGDDVELMGRLPDTAGLKNKVVIQRAHRYIFDRVPTIVGTKLVEVGDDNGTTAEQLAEALGPDVANVLYPAHLEGRPGTLLLAEVLEIAHGKGVPVLADAAGQVFPLDRFKGYTAMGADLVCFGAKYIGGPNSSGILCGKKELVDAAAKQGFIGFDMATNGKAFGRPLKLDRQEIIAVVVALQEWMAMDHERRLANLDRRLQTIGRQLEGLPGVNLEYLQRVGASPRVLRVSIDSATAKRSAAEVNAGLREGSPAIYTGVEPDALLLNAACLWEGEEEIVAGRLRSLLV